MKHRDDFVHNAKLIVAGLKRGMYDVRSVAFYLYEAYKQGLEDNGDNNRQHQPTCSYKGVF